MKSLSLTLKPETVKTIQEAHIFIVGVGGIGCELLKVLPRVGFKKFTILDLDIIQLSNLNRQFYFRQEDIKKSKAQVAKRRLEAMIPNLEITAINDSIYKSDYNVEFYRQFDAVIAAIDSNRGRAHVSKMCIKAGIPLVDGGTSSYSGQTQSVIRHMYKCHNCKEIARDSENFAACTLRNRPERPVHCIAYAKQFYNNFFGDCNTSDIKLSEFITGTENEEQLLQKSKKIFNVLFFDRVESKSLEQEQQQKQKKKENPFINYLSYDQALKHLQVLENPPSTFSLSQFKEQQKSPYQYCKLWSLRKCAQKFVQSMFKTLMSLKQNPRNLEFDKDDEDSMMIIYIITTIRTYNFMNRENPKNAHKYFTFYKVKELAGSITPAISSTNSIAAATEVLELIKAIERRYQSLRFVQYYNTPTKKLNKGYLQSPNIDCMVCSKRYCHIDLRCNFLSTTFGQLYQYLKKHLSYERDLQAMHNDGSYRTIISQTFKANIGNNLFSLINFLSKGQSLDIQFNPNEFTPLCLNIFVKHNESLEDISQIGSLNVAKMVLEYKRDEYAELWRTKERELEICQWL